MWWLYSLLLFLSLLFPLLLSFEKKLRFYSRWKHLLPAILIMAVFYIHSDILLTRKGIWGFNPRYHAEFTLFGLPVEEYLFFLVIPYASIFLHKALLLHFPRLQISSILSKILSAGLIIATVILILLHPGKIYTVYAGGLLIASLVTGLSGRTGILRSFFLTFLVILFPFLVVNGILTGSFIDGEVVWYNPEEILGIRILTIPLEDFAYGFSLILFGLLLEKRLEDHSGSTKSLHG